MTTDFWRLHQDPVAYHARKDAVELALKLFPLAPGGTKFYDNLSDVFTYLTQDYQKEEPTNEQV